MEVMGQHEAFDRQEVKIILLSELNLPSFKTFFCCCFYIF
jgi:hypothetical protein